MPEYTHNHYIAAHLYMYARDLGELSAEDLLRLIQEVGILSEAQRRREAEEVFPLPQPPVHTD